MLTGSTPFDNKDRVTLYNSILEVYFKDVLIFLIKILLSSETFGN